jgi:deoxyribodipyrimidine photo-lyase
MSLRTIHIVWFKRDLRVTDHAALVGAARAAARDGATLVPLYVVEPSLWLQPDASARQYAFLSECLATLNADLTQLGQPLIVRVGEIVATLEALAQHGAIAGLWSHEETGNGWTYARDKQVGSWCRARAIPWTEVPQNGVIRRIATRNGWARQWDDLMAQPMLPAPERLPDGPGFTGFMCERLPAAHTLGLAADPCPGRQPGGRIAAQRTLSSFLKARGRTYRFEMSSPVSAFDACSRLSPHLAFGTLSMREVAQATRARYAEIADGGRDLDASAWQKSLVSFTGRLHWHCHFIQKLESQPQIEFTNLHRAYDGLRPETGDPARLAAYCAGRTGFPFVDACLRALTATGWLNFRMRAMLVSFASYQLWLPWRESGLHLARQFTDYEPGIHWPQVQMQSGTTGINTVRMYNPVKQGFDQDPTGVFVRHWVPELAELPDHAIHEPWKFPELAGALSATYPQRIVDHEAAAKTARAAVWGVRGTSAFTKAADAIQEQHGSRKSGMPITGQRRASGKKKSPPVRTQLEFDL